MASTSGQPPCPVCSHEPTIPFFHRDNVPVANNILCASPEEALAFPRAVIAFSGCPDCGYAWNTAFDANKLLYDGSYENNQSHSPQFTAHLDSVLKELEPLGDALSMVEVGCGQGYFLRHLATRLGDRLRFAIGFDPALRAAEDGPRLRLVPGIFSETELWVEAPPTLAISRHVIEHLQHSLAFVGSIAACASVRVIALETPCLRWILENKAYYDLYYEHCSLFMPETLRYVLRRAGFARSRVARLFGGQYLLAVGERHEGAEDATAQDFSKLMRSFSSGYAAFSSKWQKIIAQLSSEYGAIALWGAASKAVAFAGMLGDSARLLSAAVDINPAKQGHYLPVTGLPIVSPEEAKTSGIRAAVVVNPIYLEEVEHLCRDMRMPIRLFPLE